MSYTPFEGTSGTSTPTIHRILQHAVGNGRIVDDHAIDSPSTVTLSSSIASSRRNSGSHGSALSEPLTANMEHEDDHHLAPAAAVGVGNGVVDPFFVFREDLFRKMELVDEALAEYLRIVHQTDTAVNTYELKDAKKHLKRQIKNAESTWKDVHMAVEAIASNREKFSYIDDHEFYERQSLVSTSRDRLHRAKHDGQSELVKKKLLADERARAVRRAGDDASLGARTQEQKETTEYIMDSQARTSLLFQHQEETLDDLDAAVVRVGYMAENIHQEIGQQSKMLDEMTDDLATAEEELGLVMGKLAKFLNTKDRYQLGTIVCLFITMVILLFLVLYS